MGITYSIRPPDYHRGLYVTYYDNWKDFYELTSFHLVLDEPETPLDADIMQTCAGLFTFLLTGDMEKSVVYYGGSMVPNLLDFGYENEIRKGDALARTVSLCERFLDKDAIDPAVLARLPQYEKAAEVVLTFLTDVTENGKYEYKKIVN